MAIRQSTGGSASYSSIGLVAWLTVGYLANGTGPEILLDANLGPDSLRSLQMAVAVAAKAVGYDPKYLSVRLLVPAGVDGPSAEGDIRRGDRLGSAWRSDSPGRLHVGDD